MKRRASVGAHLVVAFGTCLLALGTLMALTTSSSFQREQKRAAAQLHTAVEENARYADPMPGARDVLESVSTQPGITAFDPAQCSDVLSGLASVQAQGHIHLYRPDGSLVCSLQDPKLPARDIPKGDWFQQVVAQHQLVNGGTSVDPLSGHVSVLIGAPVDAADGQVGVLAIVLYLDTVPMDLPIGASPKMVLLELDAERSLVLVTSAGAPVKAGPLTAASWLSRPLHNGAQTVVDSDGVTRMYQEIKAPGIGWYVMAGIPRSVAVQAAERELHRNLWLAGAVMLVVAGLGLILHRRLARPVRKLRSAIEAARNDTSARAPVEGPAEIAAVAEAFNDTIARRRELEQELAHQALHDPLTGLPNRTLLADRLNQALARHDRAGGNVVVAFMDLDRFKLINDSKGHPTGDAILVALARRLEAAMRSGDTVARFGGDEFVVVSERVPGDDVVTIATRLKGVLGEPFLVGDETLHVSGSIGLAIATDGDTGDDLIRNADAAMYAAKEKERGGFAVYRETLHAGVVTRLQTERDLHRALEQGEFILHYQPKCSLASGEAVGVEALLRWAHPTKGLVSPADFIPVCEETGMIVPIGEWALFEAGRQAKRWHDQHGLSVAVSVNLSARQLIRPDLTRLVATMLETTGADPADLCLEITEGTLLRDMNAAVRHLAQLRSLGVRISIDDFGTGYSSLAYLRTLPLDELKIDRSFVTPVADVDSAAAIVESVVRLGHALGLLVVAEGVETPAQLSTLRDLGCDLAQGYYLARPAPAGDILPVLRRPARTIPPVRDLHLPAS